MQAKTKQRARPCLSLPICSAIPEKMRGKPWEQARQAREKASKIKKFEAKFDFSKTVLGFIAYVKVMS